MVESMIEQQLGLGLVQTPFQVIPLKNWSI